MSQIFYPLQFAIKIIGPSGQFVTEAPADTCSQLTLVGYEIPRILGLEENKMQVIEMIGFANKLIAYKANVKIIVDGRNFDLDIVAVKEGIEPGGVLLGVNFLKKIDFTFRYLNKKVIHKAEKEHKRFFPMRDKSTSDFTNLESIKSEAFTSFPDLYKLIKQSKDRCVLVIGPDKLREHVETLYVIRDQLKKSGYEGIILKEHQDIKEQSNEEKMNLLGHLSKFVICENSYPSGHIDELNICTRNRLVTVILQREDIEGGATLMQSSYAVDFSFVKKVSYKPDFLCSVIDKAVKIAENLIVQRTQALNKEYKYRQALPKGD